MLKGLDLILDNYLNSLFRVSSLEFLAKLRGKPAVSVAGLSTWCVCVCVMYFNSKS